MKVTGSICMLVLLILTLAAPVFAEINPCTFTLTPFVGGYTFDGAQHLNTGPVFGVRAGYNFTKHVGAEALGSYVPAEFTTADRDVNVFRYGIDALYHFMPEQRLVPFVAAGLGGTHVNIPNQSGTENLALFNYGVGAKYFLTEDIALRGDIRHLITFEHAYNNLEYTVGIAFQFGGKPAVTEAAPPPPPPPTPPAPVEEQPLQPTPAAEPTPETAKYCITLNILFDIDKAIIRDEYRDEVGRVATFMQKFPATTAVIEGHTDEVGTDEHNMQLSQRRAESVVNYLVDKFGIDRSRMTAKGYGKTRPIADDRTEEGRQKNRRIEAIIDCAVDIKGLKPVPDKLCLNLKVQFDAARADIKPQYHDEIARVAEFMNENPTVTALVEGHTDNAGSAEHNMKLSRMRAESVVNYLVGKFGIDRSRLSAKGYGETRRVAYNSTAEGRAKNRRVNVILDCVLKK